MEPGDQACTVEDPYRFDFMLNKADKYKCCCGTFHVVATTKLLWVYHLVLLVAVTVAYFYHYLIYLWPSWVLLFLLGYFIFHSNPTWVWPFVIWVGFTSIMFIVVGAYAFFCSIFNRRRQNSDSIFDSTTSSVLIHIATLAFCLFHIWQFPVVRACQRYFRMVQETSEKIPYQLP